MKKLLILGASGNLGTSLCQVFSDLKPLMWDKLDLDLTDIAALASALTANQPSMIINAAAYNNVDLCESSDSEYKLALKLNADLVGFLANWCLVNEAVFVHYSSDYVFNSDNMKFSGFKENDLPSPINRYGETKLIGEKNILDLAKQGLNYYIIRTSKLFGPKANSAEAKASFFDIMLKLADDNREIKIVDGERSCFTYTPDLAKATRNLLDERPDSGIYHLTNSNPATWLEGAKYLFKLFKLSAKVKEIKSSELSRPAKRPVSSVLINKKRAKLRSWKLALSEFYNKHN
jgi:dTDP-4-dehydrorhamnose reductase